MQEPTPEFSTTRTGANGFFESGHKAGEPKADGQPPVDTQHTYRPDQLLGEIRGAITLEQANYIIGAAIEHAKLGSLSPGIRYSKLVGGYEDSDDIPDRRKELWTPETSQIARDGLVQLVSLMDQRIAAALNMEPGISQPTNLTQADIRRFIKRYWDSGCSGKTPATGRVTYPILEYQEWGNSSADYEQGQFSAFLHFGERQALDPSLSAPVRLYINPSPPHTTEVSGRIASVFLGNLGYVPRGKLYEDTGRNKPRIRDDRAVLWLSSPAAISVALKCIGEIDNENPEIFAGRSSIMLGEKVTVDGRELPTVRIAQEPSPHITGESFTDSRVAILNKALGIVFKDMKLADLRDLDPQAANEHVPKLVHAIQGISRSYDIHPSSFAFNADQNLAIITQAIRSA